MDARHILYSDVGIGGLVARGSFSTVCAGTWNGSTVAVKCFTIATPSDSQQLVHEVNLWSSLRSHAHVLPIHGVCHDGSSYYYIICQFAVNGTLVNFLTNSRSPAVWKLLHQTALGLQHLHLQGIIHFDLKGNNILVNQNGDAMLSDFGLSFRVDEPRPRVPNLAPRWRAPECVIDDNHHEPSFASDIWALGMCIVEAVTGQPPWGSLNDTAVRYHLRHQILMMRPQGMTDEAWALVAAMIKYEPNERMPLSDVLDRLEDLVNANEH